MSCLNNDSMSLQPPDTNDKTRWDSVHKCPQCGHAIKLSEIDLKAVTTGIVVCPNCDWSGQIEIQIIEREKPIE